MAIITIESMKIDFKNSPVSGFLNTPPGIIVNPITIKNITNSIPENFNPLFSFSLIVVNSSLTLPLYFPNLGSTIFSVTLVPIIVISIVDTIKKYQLSVTPTCIPSDATFVASVVIPAKRAYVSPGKRLALNPPETTAKAAANPATG